MFRTSIHLSVLVLIGGVLGVVLFDATWQVTHAVTSMVFSSLVLAWIIHDAVQRKIQLGSFLPVAILLLSLIGVLWYAIKSRGWSFWRPMGFFLVQFFFFFVANGVAEGLFAKISSRSPAYELR
jgi:hypothetical protein